MSATSLPVSCEGVKTHVFMDDSTYIGIVGCVPPFTRCCESSFEEHRAGNPHATFCGSRRWVTAVGDPVVSGDWHPTATAQRIQVKTGDVIKHKLLVNQVATARRRQGLRLPDYPGFFQFMYNARRRGKALLLALVEALVTRPRPSRLNPIRSGLYCTFRREIWVARFAAS
jgi:hypothetical protein